MKRISILAAVVAVSMIAAPAVSLATTLTVSKQSTSFFGSNGSATATIKETTLLPNGFKASAGGFALTDSTTSGGGVLGKFTAWCVDIVTLLNLPSLYTITTKPFTDNPIDPARVTNIKALFETGFKDLDLTNRAHSAGFQLALWEVLYEKDLSFNLGTGNFTGVSSAAATQKGQALLDGLVDGPITQKYNLTFLESTGNVKGTITGHYSQQLITVAAVPLPAAGLLLFGALGGLGLMRRRRKAA